MKCGRICLSHGGQLPVLHRRKGSQHFMNQAKFHSTFPILLLLKSLGISMFGGFFSDKYDDFLADIENAANYQIIF